MALRIVHAASAPHGGASAHRPGGLSFTYLLEGEEGRPDNFALMLVHVAEHYHAPRHRHNFEQVRVMLDGEFGFGPGQVQRPGSVGYFCEGTYYAQDGRGPSTTLLLQVGGPSGQGYMNNRQLRAGVAELEQRGSFTDGVYTSTDAAGRLHRQDGYEAVWEHVFGRPVRYARPRYDAPVLLRPEHFEWLPIAGCAGAHERRLGTFHERELGLFAWRVETGSDASLPPTARRRIAYVTAGVGDCDGVAVRAGSAIDLPAGDGLRLRSGAEALELLGMQLPTF